MSRGVEASHNFSHNKKVLLRERKRHTARRVAIAIFLLLRGGGGSLNKNFFFPVWTCIKPNLLSKIFPFTKTGYPPPRKSETRYPPPRKSETRYPPPKIWDQVPPPRNVNKQTPVKTVPSRHTTYAGGNKLDTNQILLPLLPVSFHPRRYYWRCRRFFPAHLLLLIRKSRCNYRREL